MNRSDEDLIRESQQGRATAFDAIVERYQKKIFTVAYGLVHDAEEAKDLAQETFLRAYKAIDGFRGSAKFYTWIYRIAVNVCMDHLRRLAADKKRAEREEPPPRNSPATPETHAARGEIRRAVREAIATLPEEQRAVIVLREIEGLSYKEIAEIVGSSMGTVMSRIFYGRRRLRELLKPYVEEGRHG